MKELLFDNGVELPPYIRQPLQGDYEFGFNFFHLKTTYLPIIASQIGEKIGNWLSRRLGIEVSVIVGFEGGEDFYKAFKTVKNG